VPIGIIRRCNTICFATAMQQSDVDAVLSVGDIIPDMEGSDTTGAQHASVAGDRGSNHQLSEQSLHPNASACMTVSSANTSMSVSGSATDDQPNTGNGNETSNRGGMFITNTKNGTTSQRRSDVSSSPSPSPAVLRASKDIAALSGGGPRQATAMESGTVISLASARGDDPDFVPAHVNNYEDAQPDETTHLLHVPDNSRQTQSTSGKAVDRSDLMTPIRSGRGGSDTDANAVPLPVHSMSSLLDTNYNFDPNAVGASAPAGPSGSAHGISLHQFFFPRYNPTIQRYYRFTASPETPFAALHKSPGSSGAGVGAGSSGAAANNSGVTGLLRRSAGECMRCYVWHNVGGLM
jgi:hypothetical protein